MPRRFVRRADKPTYTVALRIDNPTVGDRVAELQARMKERTPSITAHLQRAPARLQLTLLGLHVRDAETAAAAAKALRDARPLLAQHFPARGPRIRFLGVERLDGGRVVVSPAAPESVHDATELVALTSALRAHFAERLPGGAVGAGAPDAGTPRIVVAKIRPFALRSGALPVGADDVAPFEEVDLGTQDFARVELLSALSADRETGAHRRVAHADFGGAEAAAAKEEEEEEEPDAPELFARFKKPSAPVAASSAVAASSSDAAPKAVEDAAAQTVMSEGDARELQQWREFGRRLHALVQSSPAVAAIAAAMPPSAQQQQLAKKKKKQQKRRDNRRKKLAAQQTAAGAQEEEEKKPAAAEGEAEEKKEPATAEVQEQQ